MSLVNKARYAYREIVDNFENPYWWRHRLTNRVVGPATTHIYPGKRDPVDIPSAEWDNLIVLDGCRADLFEAVVDTDQYDEYRRVESHGSKTPEWARANFGDGRYGDTVYLSSNVWISKVLDEPFHELIQVWDETDGVVAPEQMSDCARTAAREFPDKRLVIHYIQPHRPFITSDGPFGESQNENPWGALARGEVDYDTVWSLYRQNLKAVMAEVTQLLPELAGRTVITSDHGNAMGERAPLVPLRVYGHPGQVRCQSLIEVPWAVVNADASRSISDDGVTETDTDDTDAVESNLRDLGYLE